MTQLFSVYDSAASRFLPIFPAETQEVAIRQFRHLVNQEGHQFNQFAEDYTLFHLGTFDPDTGSLTGNSVPHSLGVAITFREAPRHLTLDDMGPRSVKETPANA